VGGHLNKRFRIVGSNSGDLKIAVVWDVTPFDVRNFTIISEEAAGASGREKNYERLLKKKY
jgi:hypothetical protein